MRNLVSTVGVLVSLCLAGQAIAADDAGRLWAALAQGGKVIILRHSSAPGPTQGREGDPPGFRLDDCSTQRNLSPSGRRQAVALGEMLRAHRVPVSRVLSSPWCRCLDTARLLDLGVPVEPDVHLHNVGEESTVGGGAREATKAMPDKVESIRAIRRTMIGAWTGPGTLVLVTHGRTVANVLWGPGRQSPEQGTMYVLQPAPDKQPPFTQLGSLRAPD